MKTSIFSISILYFLLFSNISTAQEVLPTHPFNSNIVYGTGGFGILMASVTGNYERIISGNEKQNFFNFAKVGFGKYYSYGGEGAILITQIGFFTGGKAHHFEMSFGYHWWIPMEEEFQGGASLGYRIQAPDKNFIFRTGLSWPEMAYMSLGVSF